MSQRDPPGRAMPAGLMLARCRARGTHFARTRARSCIFGRPSETAHLPNLGSAMRAHFGADPRTHRGLESQTTQRVPVNPAKHRDGRFWTRVDRARQFKTRPPHRLWRPTRMRSGESFAIPVVLLKPRIKHNSPVHALTQEPSRDEKRGPTQAPWVYTKLVGGALRRPPGL